LSFGKLTPTPSEFHWHGDNCHKGIGIYSYADYKLQLLDIFNPDYRYVLPFRISRNGNEFTLFAIWAMDNKEYPDARYIGQVWLAMNHYRSLLNDATILLGDFNSNAIWDYKDRVGNHSDVVDMLKGFDIYSLYHEQYASAHGKEVKPTFYMQRNLNKPYHIDYCFASKRIIESGYTITIGNYEHWCDKSDHVPIIIDLRQP
jgi:hypothetical protein